jgi:hypothetical protein
MFTALLKGNVCGGAGILTGCRSVWLAQQRGNRDMAEAR